MKTARRSVLSALIVTGIVIGTMLGAFLAPPAAKAALPPDLLDSYIIEITPQSDGMLVMQYTLSGYHVASNWPSNQPYLQIGVPNGNFSISAWGANDGADVSKVEAVNSGGSFVQFDFGRLPRNGDVFDLHFTVNVGKMAYPDTAQHQINYKFIPAGWTFPINVSRMMVTWANPSDPALLKSAQPAPAPGETAMTWYWEHPALNSSGMFADDTIDLVYTGSAFSLSDAATGSGSNSGGGTGANIGLWTIVIIALVVLVLIVVVAVIFSDDDYGSGSGVGYGRGVYVAHSCACAGCACACACAGGGKVGCSRKAIGIACLPKVIRTMTKSG